MTLIAASEEGGGDDSDLSDLTKKKLDVVCTEFDFDNYLRTTLGEFGRYQQFIVWFLCIPACFLSAYSTLDLVFMSYTPIHVCNVNASVRSHKLSNEMSSRWLMDINNESSVNVVAGECDYTVYYQNESMNESFKETCRSWTYDRSYFDQTIVTQWNLVCTEALTARTILSLLNLATLFAALYSYIQDRWGRKRAFLLNLTIFLVGSCSSLLAPTPLTFALLKFVGGITCMWEICYCWALEFVGPSQRTALTTMLSVIYCIATMSLALIAYLCKTWVEIGLCTTAPFVLLYSYGYILPESPRWLLSQGRVDEALEVIKNMARWQNVKIDLVALRDTIVGRNTDVLLMKKVDQTLSTTTSNAANRVNTALSWKEFFSSNNMLCKTLLLTFISVTGNQLYYAIPYTVENLGANFYLSYVLQAAVEAPATLLNLFLLNRFGRVLPLSLSLFLSGLCCLLTWPMSGFGPWGAVILAVFSRFFVCTGVAITEQLGGELFPTVARGMGLGVSYFVSAAASVSTQYIIYSSHIWDVMPMLIMGSFTICAGVIALFLPETMGKSMPDTVSQAESQGAVGFDAFKEHIRIFNCKKLYKKPKAEYVVLVKV